MAGMAPSCATLDPSMLMPQPQGKWRWCLGAVVLPRTSQGQNSQRDPLGLGSAAEPFSGCYLIKRRTIPPCRASPGSKAWLGHAVSVMQGFLHGLSQLRVPVWHQGSVGTEDTQGWGEWGTLLPQKYKFGCFLPEKCPSNLHLEMESVWEELKNKKTKKTPPNQKKHKPKNPKAKQKYLLFQEDVGDFYSKGKPVSWEVWV